MALCYRGNKENEAYHIVRFIENLMTDRKQVVDLFCGGCSIACALPKRFNVIANDSNPYLMSMLYAMKNDLITNMPVPVDEAFYNERRKEMLSDYLTIKHDSDLLKTAKDDRETLVKRAYIGWAGYAGSSGDFMSSFCGHRKGSAEDKTFYRSRMIKETVRTIKENDIELSCVDYASFQTNTPTVFYCDPPFARRSSYPCTSFDTEAFFKWCFVMRDKGHTILLSEQTAPDGFKLIRGGILNGVGSSLFLLV